MKKTEVDYIIVGQGLAGTVLAHTLLKYNKKILVIDEGNSTNASKVAAGLYNPIVFKRLVKSWMIDELLPVMDEFYGELELTLNENFYYKKQIVKLFAEEQERVLWEKKCNEPVGKYLSPSIDKTFLNTKIHNPIGAAEVLHGGNLTVERFLDASKTFFISQNSLLEERFMSNELHITDEFVEYKNTRAKKIIFCEGFKSTVNEYFSWLPFKLTKGEVLTIRINDLYSSSAEAFSKVLNKGVFILAVSDSVYKVGATYEWQDLTELPTEKGKTFLTTQLEKVLKVPYEILNHEAGIRPTVVDRRPLIGIHPKHPSLTVFNGLGTKGVMLAPYFANHLVRHLEMCEPLNSEVDIARFKSALEK